MEGFLVVIIAIAVVLLKEKAKKGAANRSNTTYINGKPVRSQGNYQPNPPQKNQTGNQTKMARRDQNRYHSNSTRQNGSNYAGTSQQPRRTSSQNDILYRAKMNVKENETDVLKDADTLQHQAARGAADAPVTTPSGKVAMEQTKPVGQQIGAEFDENCDIMKQINDLMIMGYSGNLEFDRDFIAEGVDMLNSYQGLGSNL